MKDNLTPSIRREWAKKLGINEQYLYQCLTGRREMSPAEARRVESETEGLITRQMLCSKSWSAIWPELEKSAA